MAPVIETIQTPADPPTKTTVVVIGGGIVGLTAALNLAERGVPVVLLEKGRLGAEQSSRNLGWIRKLNRTPKDVPLAFAAERLWGEMAERTGVDVGYRQAGIMFLARREDELEPYRNWLEGVEGLSLGARLVTPRDIDRLAPETAQTWAGGIYDPSDGYAEPDIALAAVAKAAQKSGAVLIQDCAARTLSLSGGRVAGVVTERGEIRCEEVLLAGGYWSRRFLGNMKLALPTLPMGASVIRTAPIDGPTNIAVGASDFSFRKHAGGGYIVMHRGAVTAPLSMDHLRIGGKYLAALRANRNQIRLSLGCHFIEDFNLARRWSGASTSPFECLRVMAPAPDRRILSQAMANLAKAWPAFENAAISESWAGLMDVTPDSNPVISRIAALPGLTLAAGFSGHGFGTSPAAGRLATDLVMHEQPIVDPAPYRFDRF